MSDKYLIKHGSKVSHLAIHNDGWARCGMRLHGGEQQADELFPGSRLCKKCESGSIRQQKGNKAALDGYVMTSEDRARLRSLAHAARGAHAMVPSKKLHALLDDADRVVKLKAETKRLTELWMDAVCQGAPMRHGSDRHHDGALSTWEEALPELVSRGLAEGNVKDGYRLVWIEIETEGSGS